MSGLSDLGSIIKPSKDQRIQELEEMLALNPNPRKVPAVEKDPRGFSQHTSGAKLDAGKVRPALVLGGFARALWTVSQVGTFGAVKYTENGWTEVPNGEARYDDAQMRHWLKGKIGEQRDPESELLHLSHEAWNALAKLDLFIRNQEPKEPAAAKVA